LAMRKKINSEVHSALGVRMSCILLNYFLKVEKLE